MKVLIINQHTLNFGDDIAGLTLINRLLDHKDIEKISLIYNTKGKLKISNPKVRHDVDLTLKNIGGLRLALYIICRLLNLPIIRSRSLNNFLTRINESDYIFVSPSGANIGIYQDWRYLLKLLVVCLEDKQPIFYLNTIGRSQSRVFNYVSRFIIKRSKCYVRELASHDYLKEMGTESYVGVDTAFAGDKIKVKGLPRLGYIPTPLGWHPNFKNRDMDSEIIQQITEPIAKFASENKLEIVLIPHLHSDSEAILYDKIQKQVSKSYPNVNIAKDIEDAYEYEKLIASCEYIVGMRYHAIVLAAKNSVPFISLAYENKMREVCDYTNMSDYLITLYDTNQNYDLHSQLITLKSNSSAIKQKLTKLVGKELRDLALLPMHELWPNEYSTEWLASIKRDKLFNRSTI